MTVTRKERKNAGRRTKISYRNGSKGGMRGKTKKANTDLRRVDRLST